MAIKKITLALSLIILALLLCTTTAKQPHGMVLTYQPQNDIDANLNLAHDLENIKHLLSMYTDESFHQASEIYSKGGYAAPSVKVKLHTGLHRSLKLGTVLSAPSESGQDVQATTVQHYNSGETHLELRYASDVTCHVGGLPQPEDQGCLRSTGHLRMDGGEEQSDTTFYYIDRSHFNDRTLQALSANSHISFRPHPDAPYYDEFAMFDDYYGTPHYADHMIHGALNGKSHEFRHQVFDFTASHQHKGRAFFIEKAAAYLSVGMYAMRDLNEAVMHCQNDCTSASASSCTNHHSLHSLDAAVALYTGALAASSETTGNFLFGLANDMCQHFRTCGATGDSTWGTAKVNLDVFTEFDRLQQHLMEGKCWAAGKAKEHIVRLLYVPLFQGLIHAVFRKKKNADGYHPEEGMVFAAATLPRLANCSLSKAKQLHHDFLLGKDEAGHEDFETILKTLQDHYECLDLTCEEIGGIWDADKQRYHEHAPPCSRTASSVGSSGADTGDSETQSANDGDNHPLSNATSPNYDPSAALVSSTDEEPPLNWIFVGIALTVILVVIVIKRTCLRRRMPPRQQQVQTDGLICNQQYPQEFTIPSKSSSAPILAKGPPPDTTETDTVNSTEDLEDISGQLV